jgi:hypothetical protein
LNQPQSALSNKLSNTPGHIFHLNTIGVNLSKVITEIIWHIIQNTEQLQLIAETLHNRPPLNW